ncbi:MAG: Rieske 2Fe-2S domain-containing protein, partial [Acidimicrobiaceae bacterium]|nr:Rieske 2Fe-2S domain-containing protein [Acidimicrobiaceae bacterium]
MLSREDNEILTQVGQGTPMGELLRRYWMPACLSSEIPEADGAPARVHLLGERLVAFRDTEGKVGLIEEECPHRGASLFFGRNEECGLRCIYHGWKFDVTGQCVDQPSELQETFKNRIKVTSYPVHESGGIVWAYLGPRETMTPFRDFGTDSLAPEHVTASKELVECNWVQSLDGEMDTTHISNLHQYPGIDDLPDDGTDRPGYPSGLQSMKFWRHDPKAVIEVHDQWYGFRYAGIRRTPNGWRHARITAFVMPSAAIIAGIPFNTRYIFHSPVDDGATHRFTFATRAPSAARRAGGGAFNSAPNYPFVRDGEGREDGIIERTYTAENDYGISRELQKKVSFSGIPNFKVQDNLVTETAGAIRGWRGEHLGAIYDRTREHLGTGDVAVIRMHQQLIKAAKDLADGGVPPALTGA